MFLKALTRRSGFIAILRQVQQRAASAATKPPSRKDDETGAQKKEDADQ
jgi:hypothetical protein